MQSVFNLICKLEFLKLSQVTSILSNGSSEAILTYTGDAMELPLSKSSARYSCQLDRSTAGISYSINVSSRLKENIVDLEPGIYLITVDDGSTYIIGSKDYPVRYNSAESLTEKSFDFSYKSLTKPLKRHI